MLSKLLLFENKVEGNVGRFSKTDFAQIRWQNFSY